MSTSDNKDEIRDLIAGIEKILRGDSSTDGGSVERDETVNNNEQAHDLGKALMEKLFEHVREIELEGVGFISYATIIQGACEFHVNVLYSMLRDQPTEMQMSMIVDGTNCLQSGMMKLVEILSRGEKE